MVTRAMAQNIITTRNRPLKKNPKNLTTSRIRSSSPSIPYVPNGTYTSGGAPLTDPRFAATVRRLIVLV